ncbi:MAG TPA: BTAD domain-containing putative transcriptional regulator [Longimicrobiales bacterium]|nr:BTAD domain-containing putative transcriptional regulator [Longimicrobiales bacterium]
MIRFRLFGPIELERPGGGPTAAVLAMSKATALLALLAVGGMRLWRRDRLIALLWPELDDKRARNALSKAIHTCRQVLGKDAFVTRGVEEIGLDPGRWWCDVAAFLAALERGSREEALELYRRGELLEGFHVSDAPDFEHWLDSERYRLRAQALQATLALADEAEQERDLASAAVYLEVACGHQPRDETVLRRLLSVLDGLGDRAGALSAYARFAERLAHDLDAEPAPETRALVARIRERSVAAEGWSPPTPAAAPFPAGSPPREGDGAPAPPSDSTPRRAGRRRWLGRGQLVGVALASVAVAPWLVGLRAGLRPTGVGNRVLVAPLVNRTGDSALTYVGELTADWVARGLEGTDLIEVVDQLSVVLAGRDVEAAPEGASDAARALALARAAGAGFVVSGAIYQVQDSLIFQSEILDVRRERRLSRLEPVITSADAWTTGVVRTREVVSGALASVFDVSLASISAPGSSPPTLAAYREFRAGLELFTGPDPQASLLHFDAAAQLDTTFNQPLIWAWFVHLNAGRVASMDSLARRLEARRARLTPIDRHALGYMLAENAGDLGASHREARAAADLSPGSEWSNNAANYPLARNEVRVALRYLQQVDPEHGWARTWNPYWIALCQALHVVGRYDDELDATRRWFRLVPTSDVRYNEARALIALGRLDEAALVIEEMKNLAPSPFNALGYLLGGLGAEYAAHGYPDEAARAFEEAVAAYRSMSDEWWVRWRRGADDPRRAFEEAEVLYQAGELDQARVLFDSLAAAPGSDGVRVYTSLPAYRRLIGAREGGGGRVLGAEGDSTGAVGLDRYDEARIAAARGDFAGAVALLRAEFEAGTTLRLSLLVHRDPEWRLLRDYQPFQELVTPR